MTPFPEAFNSSIYAETLRDLLDPAFRHASKDDCRVHNSILLEAKANRLSAFGTDGHRAIILSTAFDGPARFLFEIPLANWKQARAWLTAARRPKGNKVHFTYDPETAMLSMAAKTKGEHGERQHLCGTDGGPAQPLTGMRRQVSLHKFTPHPGEFRLQEDPEALLANCKAAIARKRARKQRTPLMRVNGHMLNAAYVKDAIVDTDGRISITDNPAWESVPVCFRPRFERRPRQISWESLVMPIQTDATMAYRRQTAEKAQA